MFRLFAASLGLVLSCGAVSAQSTFERASIYLERIAADEDVEVCFPVTGSEKGLKPLRVIAPDRRTFIDFKVFASRLGIRQRDLGTLDPLLNDGWLQADAGPEGPTIASPRRRRDIPTKGAKLHWAGVKDAPSYAVTVDDNDDVRTLKATIPGRGTSFNIPEGLMVHGTEHKADVGAVVQDGNCTFVKVKFGTAKRLRLVVRPEESHGHE